MGEEEERGGPGRGGGVAGLGEVGLEGGGGAGLGGGGGEVNMIKIHGTNSQRHNKDISKEYIPTSSAQNKR